VAWKLLKEHGTFSMLIKSLEYYAEGPAISAAQIASRQERRRRVRTPVHWQVSFVGADARSTVETTTQNLSSMGFHCLSPVRLVPGDVMICMLKVPEHQPLAAGRTLALECKVRIVRVEPTDEAGSYGIACEIEDYRFLHTRKREVNGASLVLVK
jgi:hypothetical protein